MTHGCHAMVLAARPSTFTTDGPGFLFAIGALRIFALSLEAETGADYLAEEDDCQLWELLMTH